VVPVVGPTLFSNLRNLVQVPICSYTGSDPIGLELAGALKNVYAIATGLADGLGFENNTRAGGVITFLESDAH